jgi:hypothetical protein
MADDYGRFDADPEVVRGGCVPLLANAFNVKRVTKLMLELFQARLVDYYYATDRMIGRFLGWERHQGKPRSMKSRFPDPPADICEHLHANVPVFVFVFGSVFVSVFESVVGSPLTSTSSSPADGHASGEDSSAERKNGSALCTVEPKLRGWIASTKNLLPLAEDQHADLWVTLEKAYDAYPWLYFEQEIRKADAWIEAHPRRRPTERGLPAFMRNWFEKAVQIGRRTEAYAEGHRANSGRR